MYFRLIRITSNLNLIMYYYETLSNHDNHYLYYHQVKYTIQMSLKHDSLDLNSLKTKIPLSVFIQDLNESKSGHYIFKNIVYLIVSFTLK